MLLKIISSMNDLCFSVLDLLLTFKWLVCYYLKKTYQHVKDLKSNGMSDFDIRNNSQILARTLSLVYGEVNEIYNYTYIYLYSIDRGNNILSTLLKCKL